jgi:predicted transposase/invertase (TIGR01784 family)
MKENMNDLVSHDSYFRGLMKEKLFALKFLETYLPIEVKAKVDWDFLVVKDTAFIHDNHQKGHADILYEIKLSGKETLVYILLEHQSTPDKWMAFRLLEYMLGIWQKLRSENKAIKKLPSILPFVFYNGKQKYPFSKEIWSLFSEPHFKHFF